MDDHIRKRNFEEMYSTEEKFGQKKDSMDETVTMLDTMDPTSSI
jgi:hypothetical protein